MNNLPGLLIIFRICGPGKFGGIARKILIIAEWLKENNVFLPIVLTSKYLKFSKAFSALGLPVHYVDMNGPNALIRTRNAAEKLIKKYNIRVVQTHTFWDSVVARLVKKNNSTIKHLFRVHTHIEGSEISIARKKMYHLLDWCTSKYVDSFCVLSNIIKRELINDSHISELKIHIIRNGIPALGPLPPISQGGTPIPAKFAVIGEIEKRKRQDIAIRAIKGLEERGINAELTLIGAENDDYGKGLRRLAEKLQIKQQVFFIGYTDDVYEIIKEIEVVVLPSDFEGIPTSIIEAMSVKKIGIATPVGGTEELIRDGENGIIVPADNVEKLVAILYKIFTSPAEKWIHLREKGFETWKKEYTVDVMMDGLMDIYMQLRVLKKI